MIKEVGIVVDVLTPNNSSTTQAINSESIGFKVLLYSGIVEIILNKDDNNLNICKGNMVILKKQSKYAKKFTKIELFTGDNY